MQEFKDKVAVITGAGRGIGRGISLRCAKEGMKIVLAGIGMESLNKTTADLEAFGAETLTVQTDVSILEDVENLATKSYEHFGAVHLLVNNAGVASPGSVLESSLDDWRWVMDVNFYGVLYCVRSFIPRMIEQDSGTRIVNVSSLAGIAQGGASYGVSKHGVVVLTESLYNELANQGSKVKVSVYCPGWVSTEFDTIARSRPERYKKSMVDRSDEYRKGWRNALKNGISIEDSANIVFEGIKKDQLYIGPKQFQAYDKTIADHVRIRTENILMGTNPEISEVKK